MNNRKFKYIINFFYELIQSEEKQKAFSREFVDFDKESLFKKISYDIKSKEHNHVSLPLYKKFWFVAASLFMVALSIFFIHSWYRNNSVSKRIVWINKISDPGSIDSVILEDGTKIWLNAGSSIKYPNHFEDKLREVSLSGEAFFEVRHNALKPFVIHSGTINTTVLGTSFNVNAYDGNGVINVTVKTGRVKVTDKSYKYNRNAYFITPDQQLSFNKNDKEFLLKKDINMQSSIGWLDGKLIFEDKMLKNIIPVLDRKFNCTIKSDSSLYTSMITANFENESLDSILQVLSIITDGKLIKRDGVFLLKK